MSQIGHDLVLAIRDLIWARINAEVWSLSEEGSYDVNRQANQRRVQLLEQCVAVANQARREGIHVPISWTLASISASEWE